ncbi:MAG: tryptophan--tRNA ligase [Marinilabiliales bacterium]|nr:MAG: tryptophan--tRNA ligase [Marinilabiliales bacterium]
MSSKIVSGIRPTGNLHLGNYFGALRNFLKLQEENDCYFFIADYHGLTTHPTPENLQENVKQVLAEFVACGLDPDKATLYVQSDVPEAIELYLFFNMNAYLGELQRVTTFKEKARKQPNNVNAGLLTYPTLMAADILIHRASKVPVGKDQEQNLEMTRTFAKRFNHMYQTEYFPEPVAYNFGDELVKVPGLDGSGKMGKSEGFGNAIFLIDDEATIKKKIMKAKTDSGPTEKNSEMPDYIQNLFSLMDIVSETDTITQYKDAFADCSIRYGDMKKQLAADMNEFIAPFRDKIQSIVSNDELLSKIAKQGRDKARESAQRTIKEVRDIIGFKSI